jgi:hypothetical protein
MKIRNKRNKLIPLIIFTIVLALIIGMCAVYLGTYYRADEGAIVAFSTDDDISVSTLKNGSVVFEPKNSTVGLIFYPGGKVEHNAYQPLAAALAREGVLCVIVKMPFNLAVFNINAAEDIKEQYPKIENWYIGGHSLGGSMAASHLSNNLNDYDGLILLGSYSTSDLSSCDIGVISIYGSEDRVLNLEKYNENKSNLPNGFSEVIIDGGCHSYFGVYGAQKGDGVPTVSNSHQIKITVEEIIKLIKSRS